MLLLAAFWPGIAGAALLGLLVGGLAGRPAGPAVPAVLTAAAALLVTVTVAGLVPGLPGLWLEGAALLLPPYLVACALGAQARRLAARG